MPIETGAKLVTLVKRAAFRKLGGLRHTGNFDLRGV
jgi:hypothetical protein